MRKPSLKVAWKLLRKSAREFMKNDSFRLAAALAYNTIFSLPPLLIIIIVAAGVFFGEEAISGELYQQTKGTLGDSAAAQIQTMIKSFNMQGKSGIATAIGIGTLVFAATTFFITLQESLNSIWNIRPKPENGIMLTLKTRLLSFGLILSVALLLLVSFVISAILAIFTDYLKQIFPAVAVYFIHLLNYVVSIGVFTVLFALIYKFLPDAIIRWKDVWPGAFITSLLFALGKFLITLYLSYSDVGSAYGAAGSIIIILVWIYYSSLIVFFGAEFAQQFTRLYGERIRPKSYAVRYELRDIRGVDPLDKAEGRPKAEGRFKE